MKKLLLVLAILALGAIAIGLWGWNSPTVQDRILQRGLTAVMQRPPAMGQFDGLKVFMCGTSSPLPAPDRAQACVAILAGEALFIVDTGAGSAQVATMGQLPLERLQAVFLTHYHSDHIAALPEFNLNSWVAGRPVPLPVVGPVGIAKVVDGMNDAYELDRQYRVDHHGAELLPPHLGVMNAREMPAGTTLEFGDVAVSSFQVDHDPVVPAVGYRFDYAGRSVVISGDANVSPALAEAASGADLLLHDALSVPIIQALEKATAGSRLENIFHDIQDYHAHVSALPALVEESGVKQFAVYHLVPPPQNALMRRIIMRDLPQDAVLTEDYMIFELPAGSDKITVIDP